MPAGETTDEQFSVVIPSDEIRGERIRAQGVTRENRFPVVQISASGHMRAVNDVIGAIAGRYGETSVTVERNKTLSSFRGRSKNFRSVEKFKHLISFQKPVDIGRRVFYTKALVLLQRDLQPLTRGKKEKVGHNYV